MERGHTPDLTIAPGTVKIRLLGIWTADLIFEVQKRDLFPNLSNTRSRRLANTRCYFDFQFILDSSVIFINNCLKNYKEEENEL